MATVAPALASAATTNTSSALRPAAAPPLRRRARSCSSLQQASKHKCTRTRARGGWLVKQHVYGTARHVATTADMAGEVIIRAIYNHYLEDRCSKRKKVMMGLLTITRLGSTPR